MRFRVLAGLHREGDKLFHKGDIVESDKDLDEIFRNKFEAVTGSTRTRGVSIQESLDKAKGARDDDDDVDPPAVTLKAIHKGGGRWVVVNTETGEQVNEGYLKKPDAKAMETPAEE